MYPGQRGLQTRREPYCAKFLASLKEVDLDTDFFCGHSDCTSDGQCEANAFGMLLEVAQNVQTLKVRGGLSGHRLDILRCFHPSLPKLTRLSLIGIVAADQNLIDFVSAFRATLTTLAIEYVSLVVSYTGQPIKSWHQVFRRVSRNFPCLVKIRLTALDYGVPGSLLHLSSVSTLDWKYLRDVEHAILSGTDIPQEP